MTHIYIYGILVVKHYKSDSGTSLLYNLKRSNRLNQLFKTGDNVYLAG